MTQREHNKSLLYWMDFDLYLKYTSMHWACLWCTAETPFWIELINQPNIDIQLQNSLQTLRDTMDSIKPTLKSVYAKTTAFVHPSLSTYTHVFVRRNAVKRCRQSPQNVSSSIIKRGEETFTIDSRQTVIGIYKLKPTLFLGTSDVFSTAPTHQIFVPKMCNKQPSNTDTLSFRYEQQIHLQTLLWHLVVVVVKDSTRVTCDLSDLCT